MGRPMAHATATAPTTVGRARVEAFDLSARARSLYAGLGANQDLDPGLRLSFRELATTKEQQVLQIKVTDSLFTAADSAARATESVLEPLARARAALAELQRTRERRDGTLPAPTLRALLDLERALAAAHAAMASQAGATKARKVFHALAAQGEHCVAVVRAALSSERSGGAPPG
jgi:hypothetical protein